MATNAVALSDLLVAPSVDTARALLFKWLSLGGLPTTAWQPFSVGRRFSEAFSALYADAMSVVVTIAAGGYLDTATGGWLTLLAHGVYSLDRNPSVFAQGTATLTDAAGAGPYGIAPGGVWVASQSGKRFTNVGGGTLPKGGTLSLTWQAESPGASYNVPVSTLSTLITSLPGVTISNPGTGGVWLTQLGVDEESDDALRTRCRARWPGLGGGATALVYEGWARTIPTVTKVRVFEDTPALGRVLVVVAGDGGPIGSSDLLSLQSDIKLRAPLCIKPSVQNATLVSVPVAATLKVRAAYVGSALATAVGNVTALGLGLGIGAPVYRAALIEQLMLVPGAVNVLLDTPGGDRSMRPNELAQLQPSILIAPV